MTASAPVRTVAGSEERRSLSLPPGPKGRRIRHLITHFTAYPEFTQRMHREFGDIVLYRMRILGDCCLLFDRDLIRAVLNAEEDKLVVQQLTAAIGRLPNGGMQTSYGAAHRSRRAIIDTAFSADRMHHHVDNMVDRVCERVDLWRDGQRVEMFDEMLRLCAGFYLDTVVGRDLEADIHTLMDLRYALGVEYILEQGMLARSLRRIPLPINRKIERTFAGLDGLIARAIDRSNEPPGSAAGWGAASERPDLISGILRDQLARGSGCPYSSNEILRDEIYLVLLAALGPTAHMLTCGFELLARNPQVSHRLEVEADQVLGRRRITAADLDRLPYAQATLREILRMRSAGWVVWKRAATDLVIGGYLIPKGTIVHPCFGVLNSTEEHYKNGGAFNPERWLEDSGSEPNADDHCFPFSAGPRMCPGREFPARIGTLLLAAIAQRWVLERTSARPRPFRFAPLGGPYTVKGPVWMIPRARHADGALVP